MAELGHFALLLAFILGSCATPLDMLGNLRSRVGLMRCGRNATIACFACLSVAMAVLWIALIRGDFTIAYVAEHTSKAQPLAHRISALWAGAAGSIMLWLWLQTGFVALVFSKCKGNYAKFSASARGMANLACVFLLLGVTFKINPFAASETAVLDSAGLNPRPQHPTMALHLPILVIGYAASAIPFAWSSAWLKWDVAQGPAPLSRQVRNWILSAWLFLTVGAALGAWSAYEQLGWEGNWLGDVAQNVSLMPWLTATALLYCCRIYERNAAVAKWMVILSLVTFSLCISAVFLTRPGLHAFPEPALRKLLTILLIHMWVLTAVAAWRKYRNSARGDLERPDKTQEAKSDS